MKRKIVVISLLFASLATVVYAQTADLTGDEAVTIDDYRMAVTLISQNSIWPLARVVASYGSTMPTNTPLTNPDPPPVVTEWSQHGGNERRTSYTSRELATPWRWKWGWNGPNASGGVSKVTNNGRLPRGVQPVIGDGRVYISAGSNGVYALSTVTGLQVWNATSVGTINSTAAYDQTTKSVFVVSTSGVLYKLSAQSGQILGSYEMRETSSLPLPPALSGSTVFVGMGTKVFALNTANLSVVWTYMTVSQIQTPVAYSPKHRIAVVGTSDTTVYGIEHSSGRLLWQKKPFATKASSSNPVLSEYSYGWPVIAEHSGLVLIKRRLDWDTLFQPWSPWPTTNDEIRNVNGTTGLSNLPDNQALGVLRITDGVVPFIANVGHGGWGDGGYMPMGPQPVVKDMGNGQEVVYTVIRGTSKTGRNQDGSTFVVDGRWDSHYGEMMLNNQTVSGLQAGDVRWIQYGNNRGTGGWAFNSNHDSHPTDEQPQISMAGNQLLGGHWAMSDGLKITDRSPTYGSYTNPIRSIPLPHIVSTTTSEGCNRSNPQSSHYCNGRTIMHVPPNEYRAVPDNGFYLYWNAGKIYDSYWTEYATWIVGDAIALYRSGDGAVVAFETGNPVAVNATSSDIAGISDEQVVPPVEVKTVSFTVAYVFNNGKEVLISGHYPHQGHIKVMVVKEHWEGVFGTANIPIGKDTVPVVRIGSNIRATGTFDNYQGDPVIYVEDGRDISL